MPNAKFCAVCGASVSALPSQVAPAVPTKRRPWFWVIAIVMIILAFLTGTAIVPERVVTTTRTSVLTSYITRVVTSGPTAVTTGVQRVKIGQTLTVLGEDNVPVEITFTKVRYSDMIGLYTADKGYKFAILDVTVKNVGTKETRVFSWIDDWTVTVDRGYVYKAKSASYLPESVRPEEVKTGYVFFEILQDTTAVEIRCVKILYVKLDVIVEL